MKLLGNRLRVKLLPALKASGLIHMPGIIDDIHNTGGPKVYQVLAVGPGRVHKKGFRIPIECVPGDRVICHSYEKGPAELPDGTMVITDDQILAVLPYAAGTQN